VTKLHSDLVSIFRADHDVQVLLPNWIPLSRMTTANLALHRTAARLSRLAIQAAAAGRRR
jgi:hypothetical protein